MASLLKENTHKKREKAPVYFGNNQGQDAGKQGSIFVWCHSLQVVLSGSQPFGQRST
ncbi:MAG: hypothetical protein R6U28_08605 [Cyclonatronaceae bacterium]